MTYEEQKNAIVAEYIKEKDMATKYYNDINRAHEIMTDKLIKLNEEMLKEEFI